MLRNMLENRESNSLNVSLTLMANLVQISFLVCFCSSSSAFSSLDSEAVWFALISALTSSKAFWHIENPLFAHICPNDMDGLPLAGFFLLPAFFAFLRSFAAFSRDFSRSSSAFAAASSAAFSSAILCFSAACRFSIIAGSTGLSFIWMARATMCLFSTQSLHASPRRVRNSLSCLIFILRIASSLRTSSPATCATIAKISNTSFIR
mmetsp:Transcript_44192/g.86420  ORF Transcript_44192/g.86420 Transcript_44192/m.86420 type:complete len:207 (+) Transcript_44192:570-1190(+)